MRIVAFFSNHHLFLEYWSRKTSPYNVFSTFLIVLLWTGTVGRALCFHQGATRSENRKSNAPPIFQVTSISNDCVSYPPIYSCRTQWEGKRYSRRGLGTCGIPAEVSAGGFLICRRHEEAARGESWSQPQIAPLGTTPAAMPVVREEASNVHLHSFHTVRK